MTLNNLLFDGIGGRVAAKVMARANRAAELEAIELLDPAPTDAVLAIGFGPGVGVALLAARLPNGHVAGVDPSKAMLAEATRRNRAAIRQGRVDLQLGAAHELPWESGRFAGVIAVNSIMLWEPLPISVAELARVLRAGGRLVTITHGWALRRRFGTLPRWEAAIEQALTAAGFYDIRHGAARVEHGAARTMCAVRSQPDKL